MDRTGMDALTRIRQQHRELESLLERTEAEAGERPALLGQLRAAIAHHVDQEESVPYPIFRERAGQADLDLAPLEQAMEQHRLIGRLARELTGVEADDAAARAKLTVLAEQVRTHLDTEDSVLLTAVEDLIDDDTLLELGRRMEQRDQVTAARRELARTVAPGGRRLAAVLGGLVAGGAALFALLVRRRRPPPPRRASLRERNRRR